MRPQPRLLPLPTPFSRREWRGHVVRMALLARSLSLICVGPWGRAFFGRSTIQGPRTTVCATVPASTAVWPRVTNMRTSFALRCAGAMFIALTWFQIDGRVGIFFWLLSCFLDNSLTPGQQGRNVRGSHSGLMADIVAPRSSSRRPRSCHPRKLTYRAVMPRETSAVVHTIGYGIFVLSPRGLPSLCRAPSVYCTFRQDFHVNKPKHRPDLTACAKKNNRL